MSDYIAPFILRKEYVCSHCGKLPPSFYAIGEDQPLYIYQDLFQEFESLRREWNKPININSGYRCPIHNLAVGGTPGSPHMFGLALDLDFDNAEEVHKFAALVDSKNMDLRMGVYHLERSFIHIDNAYVIFPRLSESWFRGARWEG